MSAMKLTLTKNDYMKQINDWKPETQSLIDHLIKFGCSIVAGDNGEEKFDYNPSKHAEFMAELLACDEAHLYVKCPEDTKTRWIFIVFGNSPGELASDYLTGSDAMNDAIEACAIEWEGKPQPMMDSPYKS